MFCSYHRFRTVGTTFTASLALLLALTAACSGLSTKAIELIDISDRSAEINNFPFVMQQDYDCAPAAVAMVLDYYGFEYVLDQLRQQMITESVSGSYQSEVLSAARRQGMHPIVLDSKLNSVFRNVAAGVPVVVLLNLGLTWYPNYHFAIVTGYDLDARYTLVQSGRKQDEQFSLRAFQTTWERAGKWAVAIVPAEVIPVGIDADTFAYSASFLESRGYSDQAYAAYTAALTRWPKSPLFPFALGNLALNQHDYESAIKMYKRMDKLGGHEAEMLNNYAWALLSLGRIEQARETICRIDLEARLVCGSSCMNTYLQIAEAENLENKTDRLCLR